MHKIKAEVHFHTSTYIHNTCALELWGRSSIMDIWLNFLWHFDASGIFRITNWLDFQVRNQINATEMSINDMHSWKLNQTGDQQNKYSQFEYFILSKVLFVVFIQILYATDEVWLQLRVIIHRALTRCVISTFSILNSLST